MGLLETYMLKKYGVRSQAIINPVVEPGVVGTAPVLVLRRNSNRIGYVISNLSANQLYLGVDSSVSATRGLLLDASGGSATSWIDEDGEFTQREVWALATGANSDVYVMETIGQ